MRKRLLAMVLSVTMIIGLFPVMAFAEGGSYRISVNDIPITDDNKNDMFNDGSVKYNSTTHTLTLNGYNRGNIVSYENINIVLVDGSNNKITTSDTTAGILVIAYPGTSDTVNCTITGKGNLTIDNNGGAGILVSTGSLDIDIDGTLIIDAATPQVAGITGYDALLIGGRGDVKIGVENGTCLYSNGDITFSGSGNTVITANTKEAIHSVKGDITISGNRSVTATTPSDFAVYIDEAGHTLKLEGTGSPISFTACIKAVICGGASSITVNNPDYVMTTGAPYRHQVVYELMPPIQTVDCTAFLNDTPVNTAKTGERITIQADAAPEGKVFKRWEITPNTVTHTDSDMTTTFVMPDRAVKIKAVYGYPQQISVEYGQKIDIPVYEVGWDGYDQPGVAMPIEATPLPDGLECDVGDFGLVRITGTPKELGTFNVQFYTEEYTSNAHIQSGFTLVITITPERLTTSNVVLGTTSYTYSGKECTPAVTVTNAAGETLTADTDYTVSYSKNINAGTATATIQGINKYSGTALKSFTIKKAAVKIPVAIKGHVYNGRAKTGVAKRTLYSLTGNTATNAGTYTAVATLNDTKNYAWSDGTTKSKSVKWSIAKATPTVRITSSAKTVKYSIVKKKTAYTTALAVSGAKGTKTFKKVSGSSKLTITKSGKIIVKKGTRRGKYKIKVKVRSAATTNYYGKTSAAKIITVTVK